MLKKLEELVRHPGAESRAKPFWAWNGKMEPEELRRQIRVMARMGMGGFFMHSRVGLATPYLGDEWFAAVDACLDEARRQGMEAWIYDEDRWPSGAAGGLVTKNRDFRARSLAARVVERVDWKDKAVVAAMVCERPAPHVARNVRFLERGRPLPRRGGRDAVVVFRVEVDNDDPWYNGQAYLDTMNPAAVREFIRVTHEAYRKRYGKEFGKVVPGIFTDEPRYGWYLHNAPDEAGGLLGRLPWTGGAPGRFRKQTGTALEKRLPELFFDVEGVDCAPARWHYHETLTWLFVDSFARQIGEWCEKAGLWFTGHLMEEDSLSRQACLVGSTMRFYEHMQAPGMDLLTEHWRVYDTAKQVASAARQFGRRWRLTETNGCTGWDFPFAGHKALGDWQAALGINLRCPHLSWYTMLGQAKRDYPASIFEQSPWWELYPKVEDYFARIQALMTRGVEVRDLLVLHPVESVWLMSRVGWMQDEATKECDRRFARVRDMLLSASLDFDYGDEELLSRHGSVARGGKGKGGAARLRCGEAEYKAVLAPPLATIRSGTLALLRRFAAAGGQVVFLGEAPARVDARPDGAARVFAATTATVATLPEDDPDKLAAALADCRRVGVADGRGREIGPVIHLLREDDEAFYLFLVNTGHELSGDDREEVMVRDRVLDFPKAVVTARLESAGQPLEYDPEANRFHDAGARRQADAWEMDTSFPAIGSRLFIFPKRRSAAGAKALRHLGKRPGGKEVRSRRLDAPEWEYALSDANALVLDRPRWRAGETGPWRPAVDVLEADSLIRDAMGIARRGGGMVQPWARRDGAAPAKAERVALVYDFAVEAVPTEAVELALECPERFRAALNGLPLALEAETGWWTDRSLRRIALPAGALRSGHNELRLELDYDADFPGLEIVYLLGNFGVSVAGTETKLIRRPARLRLGDWTEQGLPFYAGHVSYRTRAALKFDPDRERAVLRLGDWRGVAVRVFVDGRDAGVMGWPPYELDLTGFLRPGGPAELAIQVIGHRRNSHGPLHMKDKWPAWTGAGQFLRQDPRGGVWVDEYSLVPCGLLEAPRLVALR